MFGGIAPAPAALLLPHLKAEDDQACLLATSHQAHPSAQDLAVQEAFRVGDRRLVFHRPIEEHLKVNPCSTGVHEPVLAHTCPVIALREASAVLLSGGVAEALDDKVRGTLDLDVPPFFAGCLRDEPGPPALDSLHEQNQDMSRARSMKTTPRSVS